MIGARGLGLTVVVAAAELAVRVDGKVNILWLASAATKRLPSGTLADGAKNIFVTSETPIDERDVLTKVALMHVDGAGEGMTGPGVSSGAGEGATVGAGIGVAVALGSGAGRNCPWTRTWTSMSFAPPAAKKPSLMGASAENSVLPPPTMQLVGKAGS